MPAARPVSSDARAVTVVDESGQATVASVRSSLRDLAVLAEGRRTVAVLGALSDLGADRVAELDGIGRLAVRLNIGRLAVVGEDALDEAESRYRAVFDAGRGPED